jgi:hypothetical protein
MGAARDQEMPGSQPHFGLAKRVNESVGKGKGGGEG